MASQLPIQRIGGNKDVLHPLAFRLGAKSRGEVGQGRCKRVWDVQITDNGQLSLEARQANFTPQTCSSPSLSAARSVPPVLQMLWLSAASLCVFENERCFIGYSQNERGKWQTVHSFPIAVAYETPAKAETKRRRLGY
jgi:hypothetical protein